MLDFLLWNKIARIIAQLADTLNISTETYGLHLMSDTYIVNDLIDELRSKQ